MSIQVILVEAQAEHRDAMAALFREVCRAGDALPFTEDTPDGMFDAMWLASSVQTFVALAESELVGMYKLNPNLPGRASHVGSATYLVRPDMQGKGIGGAMLRDSIRRAGLAGFRSMQFNFVVSTNRPAVALLRKARLPDCGHPARSLPAPGAGLCRCLRHDPAYRARRRLAGPPVAFATHSPRPQAAVFSATAFPGLQCEV